MTESSSTPNTFSGSLSETEVLAEAQELGHIGAWAWDLTSGRLWLSDETCRQFGFGPRATTPSGEALLERVHPADRDALQTALTAVREGTEYDIRLRIVRPDGELRHVRARGRLTRAQDGTPERMLGTVLDITDDVLLLAERDTALASLSDSEERYRLLAENAYDVIWTMGIDGSITYVSPSVERMRGFTPAEAAAQTLEQIHPPETAAKVTAYFGRLFAAMGAGDVPPIYRGEHECYRKDGSIMLGELQVIPQVDAQGRVVQILGVTRDISERRRYEEELQRLARTDYLTGLSNRRQAEHRMAEAVSKAHRSGSSASVLIIDVDGFKHVNDVFGHRSGDEVLIELAVRLRAQFKPEDTIARWGGDEFVVVLQDCPKADALTDADRLCRLVAATPFDGVGPVSISVGTAELLPDDDVESWLHRADVAMYKSKATGTSAPDN